MVLYVELPFVIRTMAWPFNSSRFSSRDRYTTSLKGLAVLGLRWGTEITLFIARIIPGRVSGFAISGGLGPECPAKAGSSLAIESAAAVAVDREAKPDVFPRVTCAERGSQGAKRIQN